MEARVQVDARAEGHWIPRTIYGHFLEHLGRGINEGLWTEQGRGDDLFLGGISRPVLEAVRAIRPGLIRYPGGCFADTYHWQDGIGPREKRPRRPNRMWGRFGKALGPDDHNHFGTDEFLALCREVGAEPMLTVNVGSGAPEEAAAWVEYCNGSDDSLWGRLRVANGRAEPWAVKYWCVGNEMWNPGEFGFCGPATYARRLIKFSQAMRTKDPSIRLIAVGAIDPWNWWNRTVLEDGGPHADYLSIHAYHPALFFGNELLRRDRRSTADSFYWVLSGADDFRRILARAAQACARFSPPGKPVPIAFDEWNVWYSIRHIVRSNYNLRDGLFAASILNLLQQMAPVAPIACLAQLVNVISAIVSDGRNAYFTPIGQVFKMFTSNAGERWLPAKVECEELRSGGKQFPVLDTSATLETSGERLSLFLVNRHYDRPLAVEIDLQGFDPAESATLELIHHDDPLARNTFAEPERVAIRTEEISLPRPWRLELPPHSVAALIMNRRGAD